MSNPTKPVYPFPVVERLVQTQDRALWYADALIKASEWFALTPYPDDEWLFTLKRSDQERGRDPVSGLPYGGPQPLAARLDMGR